MKNILTKYRNGIIVGSAWGLMMVVAYEFTRHITQ